jgi:hypothetical protein
VKQWVIGGVIGAALVLVAYPFVGPLLNPTALAYVTPRNAEGVPDLDGYWQAINTADYDILAHSPEWQVPGSLGIVEGDDIPYLPAALEKKKWNYEHRDNMDPTSVRCMMAGVPRIMYQPYPLQISQTKDYIGMMFEYNEHTRIVYTNGSKHPTGYAAYMGDSRGHYEGDSLVVDVTNFTGETWLDRAGDHHSEQLHVVERFTRVSPDVIQYEATLEDPMTYSKPWKISFPLYRHQEKNFRLLEYPCHALKEEDVHNRTGVPLTPGWHLRTDAESSFTVGGGQ